MMKSGEGVLLLVLHHSPTPLTPYSPLQEYGQQDLQLEQHIMSVVNVRTGAEKISKITALSALGAFFLRAWQVSSNKYCIWRATTVPYGKSTMIICHKRDMFG